mgnify:CR=1 FL=1
MGQGEECGQVLGFGSETVGEPASEGGGAWDDAAIGESVKGLAVVVDARLHGTDDAEFIGNLGEIYVDFGWYGGLFVEVVIGFLVGFSYHGTFVGLIAGLGIVLAFAYSLSWLSALLGLVAPVRSMEPAHPLVTGTGPVAIDWWYLFIHPLMAGTSPAVLWAFALAVIATVFAGKKMPVDQVPPRTTSSAEDSP